MQASLVSPINWNLVHFYKFPQVLSCYFHLGDELGDPPSPSPTNAQAHHKIIKKHQPKKLHLICNDVQSCVVLFLPSKLDSLLKPDKTRAEELKREFNKGFDGIVSRIWPHINLVLACSTGTLMLTP